MNLIFMRHGEATDNIKEIISDKEIYWSILTKNGIQTVKESIKELPKRIDRIYVSPLPRTIQTAHLVYQRYSNVDIVMENSIREIYYGKYSGQKNNEDNDNIRLKQIDGDYFSRFGEYGENKYDIEFRLCNFLKNIYLNNDKSSTILIISHGSVISYMKRILCIESSHVKTGKIEKLLDVEFSPLFKHIEVLSSLNQ